MKHVLRTVLALAIVGLLFAQPALVGAAGEDAKPATPTKAADKPATKSTTPAGIQQEHVAQRLKLLEERFIELAEALKENEPDQAARLIEALQHAKQNLLRHRMLEIAKQLDGGELQQASDKQKQVTEDLRRLIDILTKDPSRLDELQARIDQLERWKAQVQDLIDDENRIKNDTDNIGKKDEVLANLDKQIADLENVIKAQKGVMGKTQDATKQGPRAVERVTGDQEAVRKKTEDLAKEVAGQKGTPSDGSGKPSDASGKPSDGSGKPSDGSGKPSDGSGKPSDGSGKPSDGSGQPSDGSGQPSAGSPSQGQSGPSPKSPAGSMQKAAEHQKAAEDNLAKGKGKAAQADEAAALNDLKDALDKLKAERDRIARLPKEAFDEIAKDQDNTADKAGDLQKEMAKASQSGGSQGQPGGQPGDPSGGGESQPGQQQVQNAQQKMQQASKQLKGKDKGGASKSEQEAIDELKQAQDEIEQLLAQLREEMQEETLAALEGRFREMLEIQKGLTAVTSDVEEKRKAGDWDRRQQLLVASLSKEERQLAGMADQALLIIIEDGTTVVFPRIVERLRDDLVAVSDLLRGEKTGEYTHTLQKEIEITLEELIAALEKAQEQLQSQSGQSGQSGQQQQPPLVPESAELKLLRAAQLRVNRLTKSFDKTRPKSDALDPALAREIDNITRRQADVASMAESIIEGYYQPNIRPIDEVPLPR